MSSGLTPKPTVYFPLVLVCFPMRSFNCKPDRTLFNYSAILQFKWKQGNTIVTVSNTSDFWLLSLINIQSTILGESDHQNQRLCALEFYIWLQNSCISKPEVPSQKENVQHFSSLMQWPLISQLLLLLLHKSFERLLQCCWYSKLQNIRVCPPVLGF